MKINYLQILALCMLFSSSQSIDAHISFNTRKTPQYENISLPNTEVRYITSKANNIKYKLYINIPADYYHNNKQYPAIFLLDADYSFPLAKQITEHLSDRNKIFNVFLVGIAYDMPFNTDSYQTNRTRDYTPTFVKYGSYGSKYQKNSGGAAKFDQFIQTELIPYLNKNFRLNNNRTIVGHSYGGLFATWLMLHNSDAFQNYIIVSPSLWYDDKMIFKLLTRSNVQLAKLKGKAFYGIGGKENNGDYRMIDDLNNYVVTLKKNKSTNFLIKYYKFNYDDHTSIFPAALTHGLKYIYGKTS